MSPKINTKELKKMAAYASADAYCGGVMMLISSYFLLYLTIVEQISPWLAGIAIMIGKVWDGISDPIMGVIVERTRSRWGRSRPYFLYGAFPVFLSYFMLWYSFGLNTEMQKVVYYTFAYMFFSTTFTVINIPYTCLLPRIVNSYEKRTNYSSMQMIFSGVSCVFATFFFEFIIYRGQRGEPLSPAFKGNFSLMGLIMGLIFIVPILVTFFGTKEKSSLGEKSNISLKIIFKQYRDVLRNSSYRKNLGMGLASGFVGGMVSVGMIFFAYIILSQDLIFGITVITVVLTIKGITEIAFFPVNVLLMKKFNKHMPFKVDMPLIILAGVIGLLIPAGGSPVLYIISIAFLGMGVSCLAFVPMTLFPDITDVDEAICGRRREGIAAGLSTFIRKINGGITTFLAGLILSASGLDPSKPETAVRTTQTMWGVKIIYSIIPIIACVIILFIVRTFKIDRYSHGVLKKAIKTKHEQGYVELTPEEEKMCEEMAGLPYEKLWLSIREEINFNSQENEEEDTD